MCLEAAPVALCLVHKDLSSQLGVWSTCFLLERDGFFLFFAVSLWCQLHDRDLRGPFLSSANAAGVPARGDCLQAVMST